jgi:hypothetical protein
LTAPQHPAQPCDCLPSTHSLTRSLTAAPQIDEEASIRANTTVLLGNVSQYLGEATCKRVLLNAFTRALKDIFPPARIAGQCLAPAPALSVKHALCCMAPGGKCPVLLALA